jgi:hypothetical protein
MSEPLAKVDVMDPPSAFPGNEDSPGAMVQIASTRQAQEVQAAMVVAQKFPRNQNQSYQRIIQACTRRGLAEKATYMYPKGGQSITGPSIRLAEVLAREWGNIDCGIVELEQRDGVSTVMSYAWDLETNYRSSKIFTVLHTRHTKKGDYKVTDPREIYEMVANVGSRRLRACILSVIPGDVIEDALQACDKTLAGNSKEPLTDRVRKMVVAFAELGVTLPMLEGKLGHKLEATAEVELGTLRKIYTSIKDGYATREQFFENQVEDELPRDEQPARHMKMPTAGRPKTEKKAAVEGTDGSIPPRANGKTSPAVGASETSSTAATGPAGVVKCPTCHFPLIKGQCPNGCAPGEPAAQEANAGPVEETHESPDAPGDHGQPSTAQPPEVVIPQPGDKSAPPVNRQEVANNASQIIGEMSAQERKAFVFEYAGSGIERIHARWVKVKTVLKFTTKISDAQPEEIDKLACRLKFYELLDE